MEYQEKEVEIKWALVSYDQDDDELCIILYDTKDQLIDSCGKNIDELERHLVLRIDGDIECMKLENKPVLSSHKIYKHKNQEGEAT